MHREAEGQSRRSRSLHQYLKSAVDGPANHTSNAVKWDQDDAAHTHVLWERYASFTGGERKYNPNDWLRSHVIREQAQLDWAYTVNQRLVDVELVLPCVLHLPCWRSVRSVIFPQLDPYGSRHLEPGLKGLPLALPGRIDEISSVEKQRGDSSLGCLSRDLSKNTTQLREKISPLSLSDRCLGGLSVLYQ